MMRASLVPQMALMAAVVATLVYVPLALLLMIAVSLLELSLHPLLTFGGALGTFGGLLAWWLVLYAPALVYAAVAFPWDETHGFGGTQSGGARASQQKR